MKHKFYIVHEDLPIVYEDELYKCGCGGKAIVDYFYSNNKFSNISIKCKKCGMTTPILDNIDEVINIWQKCFEPEEPDYSEYYDTCTGCSGNFGKEEYY